MDKHRTGSSGRTRNALRAHLWGVVGKVTAFVALGNWPESVRSAIHAVHEHAYFKWSDAARAARVPRCVSCTRELEHPDLAFAHNSYPSLRWCSAHCRESFLRDVERVTAMGAPS